MRPGNELAFLHFLFPYVKVNVLLKLIFGQMSEIRSVVNENLRNVHVLFYDIKTCQSMPHWYIFKIFALLRKGGCSQLAE